MTAFSAHFQHLWKFWGESNFLNLPHLSENTLFIEKEGRNHQAQASILCCRHISVQETSGVLPNIEEYTWKTERLSDRKMQCSSIAGMHCLHHIYLNTGHCQMHPLGSPRFYHSQQSSEQEGTFACMAAPLGHRKALSWEAGQLREAGLCFTSLCHLTAAQHFWQNSFWTGGGNLLNSCKQTCHMIPVRALILKSHSVTCFEVKYNFVIFS